MSLSNRHCRTLCAIFEEPTRANVDWDDFVSLVTALGGVWLPNGSTGGSRRKAKLRGRKGLFHAPHPTSVMKKGSVESAREFLSKTGCTPRAEDCTC